MIFKNAIYNKAAKEKIIQGNCSECGDEMYRVLFYNKLNNK